MAAKIDYKTALALAGEEDPEKAGGLLKLVDMLNRMSGWLAFLGIDIKAELKKLVAKYVTDRKKADKTAPPPAQVPADEVSSAPPPVVAPAPAPEPSARRISSIVTKYFWLAQGNKTISASAFAGVLDRSNPVVAGDRVAVNASPYDQFGREIASDGQEGVDRPGFTGKNWTPELDAAMWYPDGSSRLRWFADGGIGRITGGTHQRGFVPKVKHDKGTLGDNEEGELGRVYGVYTAPDGTEIRTNVLPSLRAKG